MSEPIWLTLIRIELATPAVDAAGQALGVGDEQVVADQLHPVAEGVGEGLPAVPVLLGHAVLDRHDRVAVDQVGVVADHLGRRQRAVLAGQHVGAVLVELGRRRVEGDGHLLAGREAGLLDGLHQQLAGLLVGRQVGREAALVADRGRQARGRAGSS